MGQHRTAQSTHWGRRFGALLAVAALAIVGTKAVDAATTSVTATCDPSPPVTYSATAAQVAPACSIPLLPPSTVTVTAAGPTTSATTTAPSPTDSPPTTSPKVLESLDTASPSGFSKSIESVSGRSTIATGSDGVQFYSPAGDRRVELASNKSYGEGDTIWIQQSTTLPIPWPLADPDTNFMNWVAADSGGYGADVQVASQASNGSNRLHAWLYPLGGASRTSSINWGAALIYDAPLPAGEIDVTLGLTLSSDPAKGRFELWINGSKVASGTGRTLFMGARVYGKFGIYGGPSKSDRTLTVSSWQVTATRPF